MANRWYNRGLFGLLDRSLDLTASGSTIRALLIKSGGYTFNADDDFVSTVVTPSSNEVSGGSYARQTLGTKADALDDANDRATFGAANTTFTAVPSQGGATIIAVVLYKFVTVDGDSPLLFYIDTGTGFPYTPNGSDIIIQWNAGLIAALAS
jgi:hypothetical protein